MKYLKTFEAFVIPKFMRKKFWKDEDIALDILDKLQNKVKSKEDIEYSEIEKQIR